MPSPCLGPTLKMEAANSSETLVICLHQNTGCRLLYNLKWMKNFRLIRFIRSLNMHGEGPRGQYDS